MGRHGIMHLEDGDYRLSKTFAFGDWEEGEAMKPRNYSNSGDGLDLTEENRIYGWSVGAYAGAGITHLEQYSGNLLRSVFPPIFNVYD